MAYDPTPLFDALESKVAAAGFVVGQIGEPAAPPDKPIGAVIFNGVEITELTLATGSGLVKFIVRFYYKALADPLEGTEKAVAKAVLKLMDDLAGDFDLGDANVRNVEEMGQAASTGYQTVGGVMFRLCDLPVSVKVNDLVSLTK